MAQMIKLIENGVYLKNGREITEFCDTPADVARKGTISYGILSAHNTSGDDAKLKIKFDSMASHDITYVGIIQTARASGLDSFPLPYVLTNCHNSLCAVGGTINEDDHVFGLSAAKKYGGIYVPAHQAVIHAYMREMMSGCGRMILGSDSHTRYGALGTMAIGEGGPELVKQLLKRTYDIDRPETVGVYLKGAPRAGVGPQDVALAIIGAVFESGFVKNKVMEFVGEGIAALPMDFRNGIDVMTTETACLSSIWETDEQTQKYFEIHGRPEAYSRLAPADIAYYDSMIVVDLSEIKSMIALPFHPSNVYSIEELLSDPIEIMKKHDLADKVLSDGRILADQGVIAGCAGGTFDNLCAAADILSGKSIGSNSFAVSAYPASQPVYTALMENGAAVKLMNAGVTMRTAFCGPCFGAGDVPSNKGLSIRHSTRNFPNREGSKPGAGQSAYVALMDARSIAATAANGGYLTAADSINAKTNRYAYKFNAEIYNNRVYFGYGKADTNEELKFGPNIADWPEMPKLGGDVLLKMASVILDPVTTTDELIPSGETSSYRSNPLKLAEFALSRKDPEYVAKAKATVENPVPEEIYAAAQNALGRSFKDAEVGSVIYAVKPGDGSAREQAASCQRVLGGLANIASEYATKRYRSNLINWGMLPFLCDESGESFNCGDYILVPNARDMIASGGLEAKALVISEDGKSTREITLKLAPLTPDERDIILNGCLINYYRNK